MTRRHPLLTAATAAGVLLVAAPLADAHVSIHPNVLPAGVNATLQVRVPNEEDDASTTRVDLQLPDGFIEVGVQPIPGWTVVQKTKKLANPVKTDDGTVTTEVSEISLRGNGKTGQGEIPPGGFQDFALATAIPDAAAGKSLQFKTVQTYSDGKVSRWIGALDSESPAPTVNVSKAGGPVLDIAGEEAGPKPGDVGATPAAAAQAPAAATKVVEKKTSSTLGVIALIIGLIALAVGLLATVRARRTT